MVVVVDNVPVLNASALQSPDSLYEAFPSLLADAEALAATKPKMPRPDGVLYARQKVLYVQQGITENTTIL